MLPKKNRADKKTVESIWKRGQVVNSTYFSFRFIPAKEISRKISFIVPKSVSKLAVKRNLLRRLGYKILEKHLKDLLPGITGIFIFKKYQDDASILENEIKNILDKVH